MLNLNKTCKVSLKCWRKYKVLRNNLTTFLKLHKSFQSEQILFSSIFNIFKFSGRWDFWEKKITEIKIPPPVRLFCDNIVYYLNVWLSKWKNIWNTFSVQVIDFDYSIPSSKAPFKRNITAVLFNFNFLKSWKLIFSGFNSFAECKGLYFYEHWWLGHLFCFFVTFKPGTRRHPWLDFTKKFPHEAWQFINKKQFTANKSTNVIYCGLFAFVSKQRTLHFEDLF